MQIISVSELKKFQKSSRKFPEVWPNGPQREIPIKTDYRHIYLGYPPTAAPGTSDMQIVIARRSDARFKHLDCDSEYLLTIPAPGILVKDLPRYQGPMTIKQVMSEEDFSY